MQRLESVDVAGALGRWLKSPSAGDGRLRRGLSSLTSEVLAALDNQAIAGLVKGAAASRLRALELSPLIGAALAQMIDDKRHVPVLDAFISWAARLLNANETLIREMVHERAGWFVRFAGLDEKIADKILEGLTKLFDEMERQEEQQTELQSLMRISYAVFCLKKKTHRKQTQLKRQ